MLNKDIIEKRLQLLLHDLKKVLDIKFDIEELNVKPGGVFECYLRVGDSFAVFTYACETNFWCIASDYFVESYNQEGYQFDALIYKLTVHCPWFGNLHPDPYYYDTNFFVYKNIIDYDSRYPASNKKQIQEWVESFGKDNSIFIENANTGQIIELRKQ